MSNFFQDIAHEFGVLVRHNKNTLQTISVAVSADATTVEGALISIMNAFLTARGLTEVEPIADALVHQMLAQIEQVMADKAKAVGQ